MPVRFPMYFPLCIPAAAERAFPHASERASSGQRERAFPCPSETASRCSFASSSVHILHVFISLLLPSDQTEPGRSPPWGMGWPAIGMVRDAIEGAVRCQGLLPVYTGTPIISGIEVRSPLYNTCSGPGNQALGIFESIFKYFSGCPPY